MKITTRLGAVFLALTMMAGTCWPQAEKPVEAKTYYRLEFLVKELEGGKMINSRAYSMEISSDPRSVNSSIRTGSRIPTPGKDGSFSYLDLGVNIDCRLARENGNELSLNVLADISGVADPASTPPVIRSTRWSADVIVPFRKATMLFSSDDAMSKRQLQMELTATPIK